MVNWPLNFVSYGVSKVSQVVACPVWSRFKSWVIPQYIYMKVIAISCITSEQVFCNSGGSPIRCSPIRCSWLFPAEQHVPGGSDTDFKATLTLLIHEIYWCTWIRVLYRRALWKSWPLPSDPLEAHSLIFSSRPLCTSSVSPVLEVEARSLILSSRLACWSSVSLNIFGLKKRSCFIRRHTMFRFTNLEHWLYAFSICNTETKVLTKPQPMHMKTLIIASAILVRYVCNQW